MSNWVYIVSGLTAVLLVILLVTEIRRQNKGMLVWRILSTVFAVVSLAAIGLPLNYQSNTAASDQHEAVLLTDGFNADSVTHFLQSKNNSYAVFTLSPAMVDAKKYQATVITDPDAFAENSYAALHVFGYGLEKQELENLQRENIIFHPSAVTAGITAVNWQANIPAGEKLIIQGTYLNTTSSAKKIVFSGYNSTLDSITVAANKQQAFQLTAVPKHLGRQVYELYVVDGKDTIEKDPMPVQVEPGTPLKILILAASPDFENKFLKNWLAQKGYTVVVRTSISKNKFQKDFANIASFNIDQVNTALLEKFDIVIADTAELNAIGKQELTTLQSYIRQKSMGLIIKADSAASHTAFYAGTFPLISPGATGSRQVPVRLADTTITLPPLTTDAPVFIQQKNGTQPLVMDTENRILVNSTLYGAGKIVLSTLSNSFSWVLSGNQSGYDILWSTLIKKAAAKKIADETWRLSPAMPYTNAPVSLSVQTANTTIVPAQINAASVYLNNNSSLPFEYTGTFWPAKQGWQSGIQMNGQTWYWYVYNKNDWKTITAYQKLWFTKTFAAHHSPNKSVTGKVTITDAPFPKIYFFLLFLFCSGFLWFENKYYNS